MENCMFEIREVAEDDIRKIVLLCSEFGFPASKEEISSRLTLIITRPSHVIFVASYRRAPIGWIHAYEAPSLLSDRTVEIGGLIVSSEWRNRGAGTALMKAVESWTSERKFDEVLLATRIDRTEAQAFYQKLGYSLIHTTHFMNKSLV